MLFSAVLKSRLHSYFDRMSENLNLYIALIDAENNIIIKNEMFEDEYLCQSPNMTRLPISFKKEQYYLLANSKNSIINMNLIKNMLSIIKNNIFVFMELEDEAQSLAEETLEKYEELNLLYDMITNLSNIFNENEICRIILKRAIEILNVASGAIIIIGKNTDDFIIPSIATIDEVNGCSNFDVFLRVAQKSINDEKEIIFDKNLELDLILDECAEKQPTRTILAVPINPGDHVIGAIVLIGKQNGEQFESGDLKLLSAMATYSGIAINSNRMLVKMRAAEVLQHEMKIARSIQQGLLPKTTPKLKSLDISSLCLPAAEVGGDFYNITQMNEHAWDIVVADVSGHGFGAAIAMASLRSILRSEARRGASLSEIMYNTNLLMCEDGRDTGVYATLFYAQYSEEDKSLVYCNAGHQVPLLWKASMNKLIHLKEGGMPVGLFENEAYSSGSVKLEKGDVLIIYTDGLTEAQNEEKELFSDHRMIKVLENNLNLSINEMIDKLLNQATQFRNNTSQKDDITLVGFKVR